MQHAHCDFETRSAADLKKVGLWNYARDKTTGIWCMAWAVGKMEPELWLPGMPFPEPLRAHLAAGGPLYAHNAPFEWEMWNTIAVRDHEFPPLPIEQVYCTMVMAYAMGLPGGLEDASLALGLPVLKDIEGRALMLRMARPRRIDPDGTVVWWADEDKMARLYAYCKQDVRVEMALDERLMPLSAYERRVWLMDFAINQRGACVDLETAVAAERMAEQVKIRAGEHLGKITGGRVTSATALLPLKEWLAERGVPTDSLAKDAITDILAGDIPEDARRALIVRQEAGKASVAKLGTMLALAGDDGRIHNAFQYHGASTGRWCLTGDHEVLTPTGWAPLGAWTGGKIACWNPQEQISFQPATAQAFPFSGTLYEHDTSRVAQLATAEHKMPGWAGHTGEFQVREVAALGKFEVPYTGWRAVQPSPGTEAALRVLIMTQADGGWTEDGQLRFHFKKQRKIARCKALLRRAGIPGTVRESTAGTTTVSVAARDLPLYLRTFREKVFGWWLLDFDATVVFDELVHWDAYQSGPNSVQYSSAVRQNADVLQALAHLSGRAASMTVRHQGHAVWSPSYTLSVWNAATRRHAVRRPPVQVPHEGLVYCPDTPTGFFLVRRNGRVWVTGNSGRGAQPHNFIRDVPPAPVVEEMLAAVRAGEIDWIDTAYGPPMHELSKCLRSFFWAPKGRALVGGDFSGVESRGGAWFAGEQWKLDAFRASDEGTGPGIYELAYARTFGVDVATVKNPSPERQRGKILDLSMLFGGGVGALRKMGGRHVEAFPDSELDKWKTGWRKAHTSVVSTWYALEEAAVNAVEQEGSTFHAGHPGREVRFKKAGSFLWCQLPSGRVLCYPYPKILPGKWKPQLTYMTVPSANDSAKGRLISDVKNSNTWARVSTYGGSLFENVVQALCRDLLADCMLRLHDRGAQIVLHVHDEIVIEAREQHSEAVRQEMTEIMNSVPTWAKDFPLHTGVGIMHRYGKG